MTSGLRLLTSLCLLTICGFLSAQHTVRTFGTITTPDEQPQEGVTVFVTAHFDSATTFFELLTTDVFGQFDVSFQTPAHNVAGMLEVSMVDCWGKMISQSFFIEPGDQEFQADFIYCAPVMIDSCVVIILQENNPENGIQLIAWTPKGFEFSWHWNTGDTAHLIDVHVSGEYCVTVTSDDGCEASDCIVVDLDSTASCFAYIIPYLQSDGTYHLEAVAEGNEPIMYRWNTNDTTANIYHVGPGEYCVTITDASNCTFTSCIFIDDIQFCEVFIAEDSTGFLTAHGFGVNPLIYVWNTGDTTETIPLGDHGLYCVTITDAHGCAAHSCLYFEDACNVYVHAFVTDSNTLALQAIAFSSGENITYLWNTGDTTETIFPLDPDAEYCVTITDDGGCTATGCFEPGFWCYAWAGIEYIDNHTATLSVHTDPIFHLPGTPEPTYLWSNGDTTDIITIHESGFYCVTVTLGNTCETLACVHADFEGLDSMCWVWILPVQDSSGAQGWEAVTWGLGDFSYQWTNGDTTKATYPGGTGELLCVTASNTFGCHVSACIDTPPTGCTPIILVQHHSNTSATLSATIPGADGDTLTYLWSNGDSSAQVTIEESGNWCVTVTNGTCIDYTCIELIFQHADTCGVWISSSSDNIPGILYTANAWGTPPFEYLWSNGFTDVSQIIDFGIHTLCVTVTDAEGCETTACNYPLDSCGVHLYFVPQPVPAIGVYSDVPLAHIQWTNTGDTLAWLEITAPGQYCAIVTTIFGCVEEVCIDIDSIPNPHGLNSISGFVFAGPTENLEGKVFAYAVHQQTGEPYLVADSVDIDENRWYNFHHLPDGLYILRAELTPGSTGADDYLPSYHVHTVAWTDAALHQLPNFLTVTTDIHLVPASNLEGGGVIGGTIIDPSNILADIEPEIRGASGLAGIVVLLKNASGEPLQFRRSGENGNFRFDNLPYGTYRLSFDVPGIPSPEIWVTISPANPEQTQITLEIDGLGVGTDEPGSHQVTIYPNPATQDIFIPLQSVHPVYAVQVTDVQGKVVFEGSVPNQGGILTVRVDTFVPGLYFVHVRNGQTGYHGKFIKQP